MNTIARQTAISNLRAAIEDDHRIAYRAALREVARFAETAEETRSLKAAIELEQRRTSRDFVHHLVSDSVLAIAGLAPVEPYDMDYLISSL